MKLLSLPLLLISAQAFAAQSLDITHANFQSYDIVIGKCDTTKNSDFGYVDATIFGTAVIQTKDGKKINIALPEVGSGVDRKAPDACAGAKADLFSKDTTQWMINLLDSVQAGQLFVDGPGVCTTPALRIYDSTNLQSVPYSGISSKNVPAACPN
jgi:hypothetical protein